MPNCVSEHCRKTIDESWAFCPYCGTDNRPPEARHPVGEHRHQFLQKKSGCCLLCGEPADEPYAMKRVWRVRLGLFLTFVGLLLMLFFIDVMFVHYGKPALFQSWISNWYHIPVTHHDCRYGGRTYTGELGDSISMYLGIGALFILITGLLMLYKVPMGNRNYYDYDYDDSDNPLRGRGCFLWWFWW